MPWSKIALGEWLLFAALALGLRFLVQYSRTGSAGLLLHRSQGLQRVAAMLGFIFMVTFLFVPIAAVLGWLAPLPLFDSEGLHLAGAVLAALGMIATLWAQFAMGNSWRVGVDSNERTALVTHGPFRLVRNPIYSAMSVFALGGMMTVPNLLALISLAAMFLWLQIQVRLVEEPYLIKVHGNAFYAWASRVGRFFPGVGLLPEPK